jgi:hypothetical protein
MDGKDRMGRARALFVGVLAVCSMAAGTSQDRPKGRPQSEKVSGEGCVKAGVEAACLVLVTWDENHAPKHTYLLIGKKRPNANSVVKFVGETQPGAITNCMQGTPIELTEFVDLEMECPIKDEARK